MSDILTVAEARFVRALCGSGPLGVAPKGLARALGLTTTTVVNLSVATERKGFCLRERYGMRIFLRPTADALAFIAVRASEDSASAVRSISLSTKRPRMPRTPRSR